MLALGDEGQVVAGERAVEVATAHPERCTRGVFGRLGDNTPSLFGGHLMRAEQLVGHQLRAVIDAVADLEGERPTSVAVGRPADWGPHRLSCLDDAIAYSAVPNVEAIATSAAALAHYASLGALADQSKVGVFDMGGTSVVASVLTWRSSPDLAGGLSVRADHLGGETLDDEMLAFAHDALGSHNDVDPMALFNACVMAKIELSSSTEAVIDAGPVSLRITRGEFERAIRPHLERAVDVLVAATELDTPSGVSLDRVILLGGSSAVPLIGQLVASRLGVMVDIDVHPQHCAALGLARLAAGTAGLIAPVPGESETASDGSLPVVSRPAASDAPAAPPPPPAPVAAATRPAAADAPAPPSVT